MAPSIGDGDDAIGQLRRHANGIWHDEASPTRPLAHDEASPAVIDHALLLLLSCVHTRPSCAAAAPRMIGQAGEPRWGRTKRGQSVVLMGDALRHATWHSGIISLAAWRGPGVALP